MFKYVFQLSIGFFILAVSTFIAWYEGSAIIENSLEWKYSTPFTELFNIEITNGREISQLDYFVYAVKFQPLFPTIMIVSVLYILSVIGYYLIKSNTKWAIGFWGLTSCIMIVFSGLIFNSTTIGGKIFFWVTSLSGILSMTVTVIVWLRNAKHSRTVETKSL